MQYYYKNEVLALSKIVSTSYQKNETYEVCGGAAVDKNICCNKCLTSIIVTTSRMKGVEK